MKPSEGNSGQIPVADSGRASRWYGKLPASRFHLAAGALLLIALIFIVYRPVLPGTFVMDDQRLIGSDNGLVNGEFTPLTIWFRTDFTLATLGWWLERLAWGDNPAGYHLVNILLQALSVILLWRLLVFLKIPGAWVAAALFAVHPVCVNSVARVAELKNTLSLPFYLFSFWAYLHYESLSLYPHPAESPRRGGAATGWYVAGFISYLLALLSKTTAVMLPPVLLLCAFWQRGRINRRDWLHTGPYFILALAFGLMSIWFQKHQALAGGSLVPMSPGERLAGAGQNFWFYLGKALLPTRLSLFYVRDRLDASNPLVYLPAVLAIAVFVGCWRFRNSGGRHILFGLGAFAITLFPALGFFDAQFMEFLRVSDHLQYKPLIALIVLVTAILAARLNRRWFSVTAIVLLSTLALLAFQRAQIFASAEALMRDTLARNPAAWPAGNDLGVILAQKKDYAGARDQFAASLRYNPDNAAAHLNLAQTLTLLGQLAEAEPHFQAAIRLKPGNAEAHRQFARLLLRQGRNREALRHLQRAVCFQAGNDARIELAGLFYQAGDCPRAVIQYRKALARETEAAEALNNLAWILATCGDAAVRDGPEAVRCAEHACQLTHFQQAGMVGTLAAAYAEAGRFPDAMATAETAIRLADDAGETQFAQVNRQLRLLYQSRRPYHAPPPESSH